jgi:Uma2 family endonuclease
MLTTPQLYRWTRAEYEQLAELGAFRGKRVELIGGKIVAMSPKGPRHSLSAGLAYEALTIAFAPCDCHVRKEDPLVLGELDSPEPDIAVTAGQRRAYLAHHPSASETLLVVEVADSSLDYDLGDKADLYVVADIADYWVLDVTAKCVIVLREPRLDADSETGSRYSERRQYGIGEQIVPLAAGALPVNVADLLP